jgi:hypothetical protein
MLGQVACAPALAAGEDGSADAGGVAVATLDADGAATDAAGEGVADDEHAPNTQRSSEKTTVGPYSVPKWLSIGSIKSP